MTTCSVSAPGATLHPVDEGFRPPIVLFHAGIAEFLAPLPRWS